MYYERKKAKSEAEREGGGPREKETRETHLE
jgi:hypothetical protein